MKNKQENYHFKRLNTQNQPLLAQKLYHLVQDNYEEASNWTIASFEADLIEVTNRYYGVYHLEQLVGFVAYQVVLDEATITNIVIKKAYQKQGLAQALWQFSIDNLIKLEIITIFLEVRDSNIAARKFYEASGFEEYYRRKDYYHNPLEDAILYRYQM